MKIKKYVSMLNLGVCGACHYDCAECSHSEIRYLSKKYHMTLEELDHFLTLTEESGYFIQCLNIQGPGEPLLWKHLTKGLLKLRNSKAIETIQIITNGLALEKLPLSTIKLIDRLRISNYGSFTPSEKLQDKLKEANNKVMVFRRPLFCHRPTKKEVATIPSTCLSPGPSIVEDKVYLTCTPSVFNAMAISQIDITSDPKVVANLEVNYLDNYTTNLQGKMEICKYCSENSNRKIKYFPHSITSSVKKNNVNTIAFLSTKEKESLLKQHLNTLSVVLNYPYLKEDAPYHIKECSNERREATSDLPYLSKQISSEAIKTLTQCLKHEPDAGVRLGIVTAMGPLYPYKKKKVIQLLIHSLEDPIYEIIFTAVDLFDQFKEPLSEEIIYILVEKSMETPKFEDHGSIISMKISSLLKNNNIDIGSPLGFTNKTLTKVVSCKNID